MENQITRVGNLAAAAFVVANGIPLLRCERISPSRCEFCFEDSSGQVEGIVDRYHANETCPARSFYHALQDIRFAVNRTLGGGR